MERTRTAELAASYLQENRETIAGLLCDLVEAESITCHEEQAVKIAEAGMKAAGFDEVHIDSWGNVIGRVGSGPVTVLFDAHLDVVDAEGQDWATPPFSAVRNGSRIYGRGTVDDKGPFTAALFAAAAVKDLGLAQGCTVYVVGSVAEEDCEGLALGKAIEELGILPDQVVRAQLKAVFKGNPVHASRHREGVNPIELALPFLTGLQKLDASFPSAPPLGRADVTAVDVSCSSNSLSTTPTETVVTIDRRTNTADTRESILEELQSLPNADRCVVRYAGWKEVGYNGALLEGEEYFPAWALDESHPLIRSGAAAYQEYFGEKPEITTWGFSTNGNYTMGSRHIPTIGFGPGEMSLCHGPDEWIDIEDLLAAAGFYACLIAELGRGDREQA